MPNLTSVKIFPPIGIARIGTSPETFIGPELPFPAPPPVPADGKYKDSRCRIRRQAQRFRLWGYFDNQTDRELTIDDGPIQWTVHLANAKAVFQGEAGGLIDPGPRTLNGAGDTATFANGVYHYGGQTVEVPLGDAYTDDKGRLVVAGGFGFSSSPAGANLTGTWWKNAGWHDDVSDGPVNATITVNGQAFPAAGAWVICAPPRFAPGSYAPITLYDTLRQAAIDQSLQGAPQPAMPPSFVKDIWPILLRGTGMLRLFASFFSPGDHNTLAKVIPPPGQDSDRAAIFNKLAPPGAAGNLGLIDQPANMPLLNLPDYTYPIGNPFDIPATFRKFQYAQLQSWAQPGGAGFVNDWMGPPPPPTQITPDGLTRAALENCIGAPFYPGIEATVTVYDGSLTYVEAFRFDQTTLAPGDVTKCLARPWQADFALCTYGGGAYSSAAWWPSARPVSVYPEGASMPGDWTHGLVSSSQDMVSYWSKFGFIVDPGDGLPVETEVSIVCKDCFIITERNAIGMEEAQALANLNQPITDGLYLVIEGYKPSELGITTATPTTAVLQGWFPNALTLPSAQHMSVAIDGMLLEDPSALGASQRITLSYNILFSSTGDFAGDVTPMTVDASVGNAGVGISTSSAIIDLTKTVAPYMDHGPISYLSDDTRVFKLQPGNGPQNTVFPQLGTPQLGADPNAFIKSVITTLRNAPPDKAFAAFEALPADESGASLEWLPDLGGHPVFNFALCRVRYRATMTPASTVRVFFRLFQTAATGTDYSSETTYKSGGKQGVKIPLPGVQGGELVTIPFFAEPRQVGVDLNQQTDPINVHDIQPDMSGKEVYMYYGCWLDMNQSQQMFPIQPNQASGPFPEFPGQTLLSIADLIRGTHQCMVTEISFDQESIKDGVSTASSDMLSQRNLSIDDSENPGATASRRAQHSFSFRPTTGNPAPKQGPDELMITWGNTPPGSVATIYMPGARASEVLDLARQRFNLQTLEKVDDYTLRCRTGGVTYIPIPQAGALDLAGLITVDLPAGIRAGDIYRIVVRQVVDRPSAAPQRPTQAFAAAGPSVDAAVAPKPSSSRYVLGAFRFSITVRTTGDILPSDRRKLISLHRVLQTVPIENRWYPVLRRTFEQTLDRFTALGGDPASVIPSPGASVLCRLLSVLTSLALAGLAVAIGALAGSQQLAVAALAAVVLAAAAGLWLTRCRPRFWEVLTTVLRGGAVAAGVLAILALLGPAPPQLPAVLAATAGVTAVVAVLIGLRRGA